MGKRFSGARPSLWVGAHKRLDERYELAIITAVVCQNLRNGGFARSKSPEAALLLAHEAILQLPRLGTGGGGGLSSSSRSQGG